MSSTADNGSQRREDGECQGNAGAFLTELLGGVPDDLCWDPTHHLQGHAHCGGREIVVIAARDTAHHPVVLTAEDWQAIRLAGQDVRGAMLHDCAIESRPRLLEALASA